MYTQSEVLEFIEEEDVKFIRLAFFDLKGKQKNISIMPGELGRAFEGGIPFDVRVPKYNKETISAINEAKDIMSGKVEAKSYSSAKELFDELDNE